MESVQPDMRLGPAKTLTKEQVVHLQEVWIRLGPAGPFVIHHNCVTTKVFFNQNMFGIITTKVFYCCGLIMSLYFLYTSDTSEL